MTDKEKEVLQGFLSKTLGVTNEEIAGLYNEAGELTDVSLLLEKDSQRVQKFKTEKDNQFKAGEKKSAQKFENHLKEKYGVESDLIGIDLIDHVFETKTAELQEKLTKKINPDDIEKHPAFIAKRAEWEKSWKEKENKLIEDHKAEKEEWNRKQTLAQIAKIALQDVESNFILPENAARAAALKDVLVRELSSENYLIQEDGSIRILDKDNKAKEDVHGNMISFKEHIEQLASKFFDKKQAQARGNAGNQSQQQQTGTIVIKDQSDLQAKMAEAKTPEERAAVTKAAKANGLM